MSVLEVFLCLKIEIGVLYVLLKTKHLVVLHCVRVTKMFMCRFETLNPFL